MRHDLLAEISEDSEQHEDREELVLHPLQRVRRGPEGEPYEEAGGCAECGFGVQVGGCAPILFEDSESDRSSCEIFR